MPRMDGLFTITPFALRSSTTWRPYQVFKAWWRPLSRHRPRLALSSSYEHVGFRSHAAADKHRLASGAQRLGERRMTRPEGARCTFAVDVELSLFSIDGMRLDLA